MGCLFQTKIEEEKWPYNFTASSDYPSSDQRGSVTGRLLVRDRYTIFFFLPLKLCHCPGISRLGIGLPDISGSSKKEIFFM